MNKSKKDSMPSSDSKVKQLAINFSSVSEIRKETKIISLSKYIENKKVAFTEQILQNVKSF